MKTFSQFSEDMEAMKNSMKGLASNIVPQLKKVARSDDVKNIKTDVMKLFVGKGKELINQGSKKIQKLESQLK